MCLALQKGLVVRGKGKGYEMRTGGGGKKDRGESVRVSE